MDDPSGTNDLAPTKIAGNIPSQKTQSAFIGTPASFTMGSGGFGGRSNLKMAPAVARRDFTSTSNQRPNTTSKRVPAGASLGIPPVARGKALFADRNAPKESSALLDMLSPDTRDLVSRFVAITEDLPSFRQLFAVFKPPEDGIDGSSIPLLAAAFFGSLTALPAEDASYLIGHGMYELLLKLAMLPIFYGQDSQRVAFLTHAFDNESMAEELWSKLTATRALLLTKTSRDYHAHEMIDECFLNDACSLALTGGMQPHTLVGLMDPDNHVKILTALHNMYNTYDGDEDCQQEILGAAVTLGRRFITQDGLPNPAFSSEYRYEDEAHGFYGLLRAVSLRLADPRVLPSWDGGHVLEAIFGLPVEDNPARCDAILAVLNRGDALSSQAAARVVSMRAVSRFIEQIDLRLVNEFGDGMNIMARVPLAFEALYAAHLFEMHRGVHHPVDFEMITEGFKYYNKTTIMRTILALQTGLLRPHVEAWKPLESGMKVEWVLRGIELQNAAQPVPRVVELAVDEVIEAADAATILGHGSAKEDRVLQRALALNLDDPEVVEAHVLLHKMGWNGPHLVTALFARRREDIWHLLAVANMKRVYIYNKLEVTPLMVAARHGYVEVMREMLTQGADVHAQAGFDRAVSTWRIADRWAPLNGAISSGSRAAVMLLLDAGAVPTSVSLSLAQALPGASETTILEMTIALVCHGANVNSAPEDTKDACTRSGLKFERNGSLVYIPWRATNHALFPVACRAAARALATLHFCGNPTIPGWSGLPLEVFEIVLECLLQLSLCVTQV